ncbi:MAG: DUF3883 domain-containing protein [Methanomicrobia archaeon]|nr:DUF3883 domain-containing protein [Methanomicrobia archaeon]
MVAKTDKKEWFDMPRKQWECAQEKGDKYHIYRIYDAGTKQVKVVDIPNQRKLWQEDSVIADHVRIHI